MGAIKVSVIIPVYNVQEYLQECLDSILGQTLKEIEVICIDDGSTDKSYDILMEYQKKDSRIIVLQQENQGAGIARNKGLDIARGEYLSFLDADDFFDKEMLKKSYMKALDNDCDIVMFRHNRYDHQSKKKYDLSHMMRKDKFPDQDVFNANDISGNFYFTIYGWTWDKLFKKAFIDQLKIKFQSTRIYNDMFFTYSAIVAASKLSYMNDVLMFQRVNRTGSITKSVNSNWQCIIEALVAVKCFLVINNFYNNVKVRFLEYAIQMIYFTIKQLDDSEKRNMSMALLSIGFKLLGFKTITDVSMLKTDSSRSLVEIVNKHNENKTLCDETIILEYEKKIHNIECSKSYKIGRIITFAPRKVRGGICCLKEHGVMYTLRRILEKLKCKNKI